MRNIVLMKTESCYGSETPSNTKITPLRASAAEAVTGVRKMEIDFHLPCPHCDKGIVGRITVEDASLNQAPIAAIVHKD